MQQGPVLIRKYPNRRLYDTSAGRYVNLDDVAEMVRNGTEVRVEDSKSGEDVTRMVLTQIIVEKAKDQPGGLPLELLRQLIVTTDRAGQEFLMWYLNAAFDAYQKVRETVGSAARSPFQMVRNLLTPEVPAESEVEQLRRRVAELESMMKAGRKTRRKS